MTNFDDGSNDDLDGVAIDQDAKAELLAKVEAGDVEAITAYAKRFQENYLRALQSESIAFFARLKEENLTAWLTLKERLRQNKKCPQRILVVARAGWYEDGDKTAGFMLPHGAVPFVEGYHLPILAPSARTARYSQRGTFEQWCDGAARLAGQHTLGVFRMSTALTLC